MIRSKLAAWTAAVLLGIGGAVAAVTPAQADVSPMYCSAWKFWGSVRYQACTSREPSRMGHAIAFENLGPNGQFVDYNSSAYINGSWAGPCQGASDYYIPAYQGRWFWCFTTRVSGYGYRTVGYARYSDSNESDPAESPTVSG